MRVKKVINVTYRSQTAIVENRAQRGTADSPAVSSVEIQTGDLDPMEKEAVQNELVKLGIPKRRNA